MSDSFIIKSKYYKEKLYKKPNNGKLWLEYGDFLYEECDNPQKTVFAYEKAQSLLPDKDLRLWLGPAYDRAGDPEKGISLIKSFLEKKPCECGYCILADIYLKNDLTSEARLSCKKALEINPSYEEAFYLLGEISRKTSIDEAINYYKEALKIDPDYQIALQALGSALVGNNDTIQEGIEYLKKAIELDPNDGWAIIYLANALWRVGNYSKAEEYYKLAISVYPDYKKFQEFYDKFLNSLNRTIGSE